MSRNLCQTECDRCGHEPVRLEEPPRIIGEADAGRYANEYRRNGLMVANATCPVCDAQYLAWVTSAEGYGARDMDRALARGIGYFDLSYRSTFNDEPGEQDLPKPSALVWLDRLVCLGQWDQEMRDRIAVALGAARPDVLVSPPVDPDAVTSGQ